MKRTFHVLVWVVALVLLLLRDVTVAHAAPLSLPPTQSGAAVATIPDLPVEPAAAPFPSVVPIALDAGGAHSVQAVDLDHDGDLDVISASRNDGRVIWHENLGGNPPGFRSNVLAVALGSYMAIPADINRDGWTDIVVAAVGVVDPSVAAAGSSADAANGTDETAAAGAGKLFWLQNRLATGQGFAARTIAEGLNYPVAVYAADFNGDGLPDLVAPTRDDGRITWYENRGGGASFVARSVVEGLVGAVSVHGGDIDGDGKTDIVAAIEDSNQMLWFRNNGANPAGFEPRFVRNGPPPPPGQDYAKAVFAADIDGDGDIDVAYASEGQNQIGWYENLGRGGAFAERVIATNMQHAKMVYVTDVDQDGDQDILAAAHDSGVAFYENTRGKPPVFVPHVVNNAILGARSVFAADINGDGALDLLSASRDDNKVLLYPNLATHNTALFAPQAQYVVSSYKEPRMALAADLNNDGRPDIVSVADEVVAWHRNDGGTPPTFTRFIISQGLSGGRWIHAADLDNDGDLDLAVADTVSNRITWYENQLPAPGAVPSFVERLVSDQGSGPRDVRSADLDGDGLLDLYSANDGDNTVTWFKQRRGSTITFERRVVTTATRYARSSYAADLNLDGKPDLMSASADDGLVAWYRNDGSVPPNWDQRALSRNMPGARHIYAADMDGDGDLDVIAGAEFNSTIAWYENQRGSGPSFEERTVADNATGVHAVTAGDLDRDGDLDLAAALESGNRIVWYENTGGRPPKFVEHTINANFPVAHSVALADVDGDGDLDVLATARGGGQVAWFENVGGQYSAVQNTGVQVSSADGTQVLADIVFWHRGRAGDAVLRVNALTVRMTAGGRPLTVVEAASLFSGVSIYQDSNANGALDGADALLAKIEGVNLDSNGQLLIPLDGSLPGVYIGPGGGARYFVVGQTRSGACLPGGSLQVTHIANKLTVANAVTGYAARAEFMRAMDSLSAPQDTTQIAVIINELMPDNTGSLEDPDEPQEYPDWIELYNPSRTAVDLGGMYLSDDPANPKLFRIPNGVTIGANGYLVFIADDETSQGPLHTNFRLSKGGEGVILIDKEARGFRLLDQVTYGGMPADVSYGRYPNGSNSWKELGAATPGSYNFDQPLVITSLSYLPLISSGAACR